MAKGATKKKPAEPLPAGLNTLMRIEDVCRATSFSERKLFGMVATGDFPKPLKIGQQSRWSVAMLFRITHDDIKDYHAKIREHLKMNEAQKAAGVEPDMVSTAD